jgi:hypothetical protein
MKELSKAVSEDKIIIITMMVLNAMKWLLEFMSLKVIAFYANGSMSPINSCKTYP